MDTNKIKRFATEARTKLKEGIAAKIITLGFDKQGNVPENLRPQLMQGGSLWNGQLQTEGFYHQWMSLYNRVQQKGINEVYEEAAYTWFNRLCAIRILQKNNLCESILDYVDAARTPKIVDDARQGKLPPLKGEDRRGLLMDLLDDDTKVTEQFAVLITAWCHDNPIINSCFGGIADYTELLLPNNILAEGGFVDMLNHTDTSTSSAQGFITDENYASPELIGWLYQFYISERKDEVFAKKGKFEADEIPAATQIFTPNWIVKYMVQNTVGRIYLDNNPYETQLQKKWQYLVEPAETETVNGNLSNCKCSYDELTDLKVADLACGSGHILNECFDLLYDLYIAEGYGRAEAIEDIFKHNLTGIDLDTRAKQLATFALMLKACQKDESFADAHCMPNILTMPKPWDEAKDGDIRDFLHHYFQGQENKANADELADCFDLMQNADSLGSIMKFNISDSTRLLIKQTTEYWCSQEIVPEAISAQIPAFKLILALTEKYHALVMNPPYMGSGNMNNVLGKYVKDEYEKGKADLCTAFMLMQSNNVLVNGFYANIIPPSWMFLSTFEGLRRRIIEDETISSLLHLSRGVFGADFGSVSTVIKKTYNPNAKGTYFRLIERTFQEFDQKHLQQLFEKTLANHDFKYFFADYSKDVNDIEYSEKGAKIYYPDIEQRNYNKIPGCPIGYWLSDDMISLFASSQLAQTFKPRAGLSTTNNDRFLRFWHEVSKEKIYVKGKCRDDLKTFSQKWVPMTKGGTYRKWYGNNEYVLNFENDGEELKYWITHNPNDPKTTSFSRYIRNYDSYCLPGISFSDVACGNPHFRWQDEGMIPNSRGPYIYTNDKSVLGYLNGKVAKTMLTLLCPTLTFNVGDIGKLPFIHKSNKDIEDLVLDNICFSRADWDAHETSWDFKRSPIYDQQLQEFLYEIQDAYPDATTDDIGPFHAPELMQTIETLIDNYKAEWEDIHHKIHHNEEELNRQFIEIYGLQDELTPDVPLDEITILQQGEISIVDNPSTGSGQAIQWHDDVIMKQLSSYAVGCMMGRYSIYKPGLILASQGDTIDDYTRIISEYMTEKGIKCSSSWGRLGGAEAVDDDAIIPLMPNDCGFSDNASLRFSDFIRQVFGDDNHVENLNYVEQCLGKTVEQYFVKDFWKDHKKMYQNRPIYWLFSSKKGAFQVITYMHRMNAYTVERIRAKYLLPYIEHLQGEINKLDMRRAELSTKETKTLQNLKKQLDECREYHDRLQVVAEQAISFDLDDGVVVNYAKFGDVVSKIK